MFSNLLAVDGFPKYVGISEAALTALIGYIVVFLGITFLIFIVWLIGKIISKGDKKEVKKEKPVEVPKEKPKKPVALETKVVEEEVSEETVAVITAAIMAYYQKNNPKCEFTVKRIKRF